MCVDDCTEVRNDRQAGQVVPFMALVIVLVVVAVLALARAGSALDDSARARTAAERQPWREQSMAGLLPMKWQKQTAVN